MSITLKSNLLFQLVLRHDYFRDGLAKGLLMAPTRSGASQLSRFGGRFVADEGGGGVIFPTGATASASTSPASPTTQFPDNVALSITVSDPLFGIYTSLPTLAAGTAWYCNNLDANKLGITALVAMAVKPEQFTLDFAAQTVGQTLGAMRTLQLARLNGQMVVNKTFFASPTQTSCIVDMRLQSDGAYILTLTVEGMSAPITQTFFKSADGRMVNQFGFFEWYAAATKVSATGKPKSVYSPMGQAVQVQLHARETIWQYYLVSKTGTKVQRPSIAPVKLNNRVVKFAQTGQMLPLPNGSYATQLTANATIPLQESQNLEIMLEAQGLAKGMRMPYAAPNLLYETTSGGPPSSKIYVYF